MNARLESFRITGLVAGIAVALVLLGLGLIVVNTVGSRGAQPEMRSGLSGSAASSENPGQANRRCSICGTVESIRTLEVWAEAEGAGLESGRSVGVPAGREPGQASDSSSTTLFGTAGSFLSGVGGPESGPRKRNVYRVTVRMDDGTYRAVSLSSPPEFTVGNRVRVVQGRLVRA